MTTEIVKYNATDDWAPMMPKIAKLSEYIAQTEFVPKGLRGKAPAVAAAILTGREVGLPPMTAMAHIDVIDGMPTMDPEMMRALVYRQGHELIYVEMTKTRCVIKGRRKEQPDYTTVVFTIDEAKDMGLVGKDNWRKQPQNMLVARCTSRACRLLFPDVIGGLSYTPEEVTISDAAVETEAVQAEPEKPRLSRAKKPLSLPTAPESGQVIIEAELIEEAPPLPYDEPSSEPVVLEAVDEPRAAPITQPQTRKMLMLFNELGIEDREDRLTYTSGIVKRELGSSKELSKDEAINVISALENHLYELRENQS